jgi:hypothetical protein
MKKNQMGLACGTYGEYRNIRWDLMVKPNGKRPLGKPKKKWENNMKIGLTDIAWDGAGWIKPY